MSTASNATFALLLAFPGTAGIGTVSTTPVVAEGNSLYSSWVALPATTASPSSRTQASTRELASMTGWSQRRLAKLLRVTHPTVKALIEGRSTSSDIASRAIEAHGVVRRVHTLVGGDVAETARVLDSKPEPGRKSAADLVSQGKISEGLLAAIDTLNPPRAESTMMTGLWPSKVGAGTHDPSET